MRDFNPLVSIVIPVYNGADFLSEAIDSALAQTYRNLEVIVVNDGSTDGGATERIALSYGDKIRYFSKPNGGVSSALNLGIEKMKGEYFSWLSHDDLYAPKKIEYQVNLLADVENREFVIALCGNVLINTKRERLIQIKRSLNGLVSSDRMFSFCCKGYIGGCALLVPKSAFVRCGAFINLRYRQDFECWMRFILNGYSFICGKEEYSYTRIHVGQVTCKFPERYYEERPIVDKLIIDKLLEDVIRNGQKLKEFYLFKCSQNDQEGISMFPDTLKKRYRFQACVYKFKGWCVYYLKIIYRKYVKKYNK